MTMGKSSPGSIEVLKNLRAAWRLLWDKRMPLWTKLIPLGAAIYLIWPADLLADPALGLGQIDDLALILLAARLFIALAPDDLLAESGGRATVEAAPTVTIVDANQDGKTRLLERFEADDRS